MRRVLLAGIALLTAVTAISCSNSGVSAQDAYQIGCPAVDAAVAGGSAANSATIAGLKALRDSGQLGSEAQSWVAAAVTALEDPNKLPPDAKRKIIDGCAKNGYPLHNLKG